LVHDLPAGGKRIVQRSRGYRHTFVHGVEVTCGGNDTGARPGHLLRGARSGPGGRLLNPSRLGPGDLPSKVATEVPAIGVRLPTLH
jgi:hypothetical protein